MISLTSPVRTRAHDWPAGAKLAGMCLATMGLFHIADPAGQLAALIAVLVLYASAGVRFLKAGLRRLTLLWPFLAIIVIWHLATQTPAAGAVIALRMLSAVALANLVTMTTRLSDMVEVIRFLATPLRRLGMRTGPLEISIALVVRFTPVLLDRARQLILAWRARSRRRASGRIVLPFAVMALDEADHVAEALRARGALSHPTET